MGVEVGKEGAEEPEDEGDQRQRQQREEVGTVQPKPGEQAFWRCL
jgi:hypothetical protein